MSVLLGNLILEYNVDRLQAGTLKIFLSSKKKWLLEFLDRPDVGYTTPGRKDHWYVGKHEGQRQHIQKRYLFRKIRDPVLPAAAH